MPEQVASSSLAWWRQFSLKSLMIAITVICVLCALLAMPPLLAFTAVLVQVGITGTLAMTLWHGRGWIQAFSAGALLPHLAGYLFAVAGDNPLEVSAAIGAALLITIVAGTAGAALHGALARRDGLLPVPDLPGIRNWFSNAPIGKPRDRDGLAF